MNLNKLNVKSVLKEAIVLGVIKLDQNRKLNVKKASTAIKEKPKDQTAQWAHTKTKEVKHIATIANTVHMLLHQEQ